MNQLLQQLSLKPFRGVTDASLEDLRAISVIVGENNAGKSSFLEAAGLILRPLDPNQWRACAIQRDSDANVVEGLWALFPDTGEVGANLGIPVTKPMQLEAQLHSPTLKNAPRSLVARFAPSERLDDRGEFVVGGRVDVEVDGQPPVAMHIPGARTIETGLEMYRVFTVNSGLHHSSKLLVDHLSHVVDAHQKPLAVQILQLFDPDVEDLDVTASYGRLGTAVTHRKRGVVDLVSFGDGMRRATALALVLVRASGGVLLIDELEAGIHRSVLQKILSALFSAARELQVQIIATTHSLETLDAVMSYAEDSGQQESVSVYWMKRDAEKHRVKRFGFSRLHGLRQQGLDIR